MDIQLKNKIATDRKNAGCSNGFSLSGMLLPNYSIRYIKLMRKTSYYKTSNNIFFRIYGHILSIFQWRLGTKLGFYIPKDVFGPGLYIPHTGSVIVNPSARIGANCCINNNVIIGQNKGKCPVIGDNVFIGSGANICGDIKIANNVWIGANAVVTKSIEEENVLVAGIPAKIVSRKRENWLKEFGIDLL